MFRLLALGAGIVALSAFPAWADNPPLASLTQDLIRLTKAGVDEGVVLAFVDSRSEKIAPTDEDFTGLKEAGASPSVLTAVVRHDARWSSAARPVTEAQVYRLFGGNLYHEGRVYGVGAGLPKEIEQELISDPGAQGSIVSSSNLKGDALGLTWGGLATTVGGVVLAGVSQAQNSPSWGSTVGLSAVGLGVVSMIVGSVVDAVSYHDLYQGLYRYNEDLIHASTGGKS